MTESHQEKPKLPVRLLVAGPRSGSAVLMRILAESGVCALTSRLDVLHGDQAEPFTDDSFLESPMKQDVAVDAVKMGKQFLISTEHLGSSRVTSPGPRNLSAYSAARPVFLIRDPIRVLDSWKKLGLDDMPSLIACYHTMARMIKQAPPDSGTVLLYERLVQEPIAETMRICEHWHIHFEESMLEFARPLGDSFLFPSQLERKVYCERLDAGHFTCVDDSASVRADVSCHNLLSNAEKYQVETQIGPLYMQFWASDVERLRGILAQKTWFGFDLDDTLHEFRRSSGAATRAVIMAISSKYGTSISVLQQEHSNVLKEMTANAFSDGKTSKDYRTERLSILLMRFSLPVIDTFMAELLELYETTLLAALELKSGALDLLKAIKSMGKKVVIITEGPQDSQERTINGLGIDGYVDFLATTNHFQVSKVDGLFNKVLENLKISPADIAYIGDSEQRDVIPASSEGIFSFHFAQGKNVDLSAPAPRINTLNKLEFILSSDRR